MGGLDEGHELIRQTQDRDLRQIDLLVPRQVQQQVQRPLVGTKIDDQPRALFRVRLVFLEIRAGNRGVVHRQILADEASQSDSLSAPHPTRTCNSARPATGSKSSGRRSSARASESRACA